MVDINKMKDIYDIKDILLGFPFDMINSLIFIIFIIILYVLYKYFLRNNKIISTSKTENDVGIIKNIDFKKIINDFENTYKNSHEKIFYSKLLYILRNLLEYQGIQNISKMTFKEINNLEIDKNLINLIKSIYYKEYKKEIEDNNKMRLKFIENIRQLIK